MSIEGTLSFLLMSVPLYLLLVFFCILVHIWLRPTTITLCAPASVVSVHVVMSVYVEREEMKTRKTGTEGTEDQADCISEVFSTPEAMSST